MSGVKIVATIGPACATSSSIKKLILAGVNVFRINFSHSNQDNHARSISMVRKAAHTLKQPIAILADLQGPKIRTGLFQTKEIVLKRGETVTLTTKKVVGDAHVIAIDYPKFPDVVKKGMTIFLSEGLLKLTVLSTSQDDVVCKVLRGGVLGERKGVNVVGIKLASAFTGKDKSDILFALKHDVDYFALSFVRNADDVKIVKKFIEKNGGLVPIIAKIEKPEAVRAITSIVNEAYGVMVARGDLGVEGKLEDVPIWQKKIIREANKKGKIVITATQMLESMISSPLPTRAEVTDVANAVLDGTCAVMLSGETAIGKYPLQVVRTMRRVVRVAERSNVRHYDNDDFDAKDDTHTYAIAHAAIDAAVEARAKALIVFTLSGKTAAFIAKRRPSALIFAITPYDAVYRRMSLVWGVEPFLAKIDKNIDRAIQSIEKLLVSEKYLKNGDSVVVVYGLRDITGGTDRIKIMTVGDTDCYE